MANLAILYGILREWARAGHPQTYGQLSQAYFKVTGVWLDPHFGLGQALGDLNNLLANAGAPAMSALVIVQGANEPGHGFWGAAPNVPPRPANDDQRIAEWVRILNEVRAFDWPDTLDNLIGARRIGAALSPIGRIGAA